MYQKRPPKQTNTANKIAVRASIGTWWGSWLTAGLLGISLLSLEYSRKNVANTQRMTGELSQLNKNITELIKEKKDERQEFKTD